MNKVIVNSKKLGLCCLTENCSESGGSSEDRHSSYWGHYNPSLSPPLRITLKTFNHSSLSPHSPDTIPTHFISHHSSVYFIPHKVGHV